MRQKLILLLILCLLGSSGCYHPDIQQGNDYSVEAVKQIEVGMTKAEVIQILGQPLLSSPFNPNELTYVFYDYPQKGSVTRRHVTFFFKGEEVEKIQSS